MFDLKALRTSRESNTLEAKLATGGFPKSLWETYSSFANTDGGVILLGVEELDDKSLRPVGLPNPEDIVEEFWETVNDREKVSANIMRPEQVRIELMEGHPIVVIEVPRADRHQKPIYLNGNMFQESYRRDADGDYRCSENQVRDMLLDQSDEGMDSETMKEFTFQDFCQDTVKLYREDFARARKNLAWNQMQDEDFMVRIGALQQESFDSVLRPTMAGLLMFGREDRISRKFPEYFLDYCERAERSGPYTFRLVSNSEEWSGNVYDFYREASERLVRQPDGNYLEPAGVREALREALLNAVIHANYFGSHGVVVERTPETITIANPGSLRVGLRNAMDGGSSDPRNTRLFKLFSLIKQGKGMGRGIANIRHVWAEQGWEAPLLSENYNPDRTVLRLKMRPARSDS